jgi:hypothetical protein
MNYKSFKEEYLIEGFIDKSGNPKHTRFVKRLFYRFSNELKKNLGLIYLPVFIVTLMNGMVVR